MFGSPVPRGMLQQPLPTSATPRAGLPAGLVLGHKQRHFSWMKAEVTQTQLFTTAEAAPFIHIPAPPLGPRCSRAGARLLLPWDCTSASVRQESPWGCSAPGLVPHSTKLCCASLHILTRATIPKVTPSWMKVCFSELELCSHQHQYHPAPGRQGEAWTPTAPPVPRTTATAPACFAIISPLCSPGCLQHTQTGTLLQDAGTQPWERSGAILPLHT